MIVSDIISRVRKIVGDNDSIQVADADFFQWINDAMRECASDNQLLQKTASTTTVIGTNTYTIPTDILKLHTIKINGVKIRLINQTQFDEFTGGTDGTETGEPSLAYVWAGVLTVFPKPDLVYNLDILYTRTPVEVTATGDSIDLPVMYHRRIVDYCLAMVAEQDDDMNRYQIKMTEFKSGVQSLKDQPEWSNDLYPSISMSDRDMGEAYDFFDQH